MNYLRQRSPFHLILLTRTLQTPPSRSEHQHCLPPQTDGQSECTNQWVEQYLRIFGNFHQNDWSRWLPLAQYTHNFWPNTTTKKTPFELIMGHTPHVHQPTHTSTSPSVNDRLKQIMEFRQQAKNAVKQAQELITRLPLKFTPYKVGDKVWLDARHLNTSHPSAKLAPKRYRPFKVTKAISCTSFQLQLPFSWKIHPTFVKNPTTVFCCST